MNIASKVSSHYELNNIDLGLQKRRKNCYDWTCKGIKYNVMCCVDVFSYNLVSWIGIVKLRVILNACMPMLSDHQL